MKKTILSLEKINCGYDGKSVIHDINLSVYEGDFISIIGPNGSGKTTLLKTISSELKPVNGEIRLYEKILSKYDSKERSSMISFVFTLNNTLPDYTIEQFLELHTFPHDKPFTFKKNERVVTEAVEICGITHSLSSSIKNLSSGEFQLVQLAGAYIQNSRFIILDEPVSHLDPKNAKLIISLLKKLNANGTTIITVLHDLNIALNLPGKIAGLKKGKVFFYDYPEHIYNKKLTDKLYDIEFTYYQKNKKYYCLNNY